MKRAFLVIFVLLLSARLVAQPQAPPLAITHVTVIDATGAKPKPDQTVVLVKGKITALGKTGQVKVPDGAQVVDGTGKFLIPGLWETHAHATIVPPFMNLYLVNGVTGVRDLAGAATPGIYGIRKEIADGKRLGPRLILAGRIVDGPKPVWPGSIGVTTAEEGREAVRTLKKDGADFVKVYSLLPRDAFFAIADEAKKQKMPFDGHVPEVVTAAEASDAGQRCIEHLQGVLRACSSQEDALMKIVRDALAKDNDLAALRRQMGSQTRTLLETYDEKRAEALFAKFKKNGTWHCPTLTVLRNLSNMFEPDFTNDPRLKYMPVFFKAFWNPKNDPRFKNMTQEAVEGLKRSYQKHRELVGKMRVAGVSFLAGTDVANPNVFPGFSLHDELALLVEVGLTPMEALQAATRNPAQFLGLEKTLGTVEVGKEADLVLLDADPLADIKNTTKIRSVVVRGRLLDRKALDDMLAKAETAAKSGSLSPRLPGPFPGFGGFCFGAYDH